MINKNLPLVFICILLSPLIIAPNVQAAACNLDVDLINQDPYPAIPGEEVKIVFQVNGLGNPDCGKVTIKFIEEFPFSLITGEEAVRTIKGGTFTKNFKSFAIVPYKVLVNKEALKGESPIEVAFGEDTILTDEFNVTIEDVRADFEISIKDYIGSENKLVFEILNIGESDVEALTIEIERQENIILKGSKRNIVGALDSNEDTTLDFEAIPSKGEIFLTIFYTDQTGVRRTLEKTVIFDPDYFTDRKRDEKNLSPTFYIVVVLIIIILAIWIRSIYKKRKRAKLQR